MKTLARELQVEGPQCSGPEVGLSWCVPGLARELAWLENSEERTEKYAWIR